jgi:hypothetical protein
MKIRTISGWDAYTSLMDDTKSEREQQILHNMRLHHKYECLGDPRIFDTMVPEPEYRFYGSRGNPVLVGMEQVQAFYYAQWESQSSLVELDVSHLAFADWGAAAAGSMRQQVPAAALGDRATSGAEWYLVETHLSWFFPYRDIDGDVRLEGEVCHIDGAGAKITPISPEHVLTMEEAVAEFAHTGT